eukprot:4239123-Pleurochrysis_carterae.AAC.1
MTTSIRRMCLRALSPTLLNLRVRAHLLVRCRRPRSPPRRSVTRLHQAAKLSRLQTSPPRVPPHARGR